MKINGYAHIQVGQMVTPTNTRISYVYWDAYHYKRLNCHVIAGRISEAQILEIMDSLPEGGFFIPSAVGLPEKRFDDTYDPDVDGPWFELSHGDFAPTLAPADLALSVNELVENFRNAAGSWEEIAAETAARLSVAR